MIELKDIKCKDFNIYKIRYYADRKLLDKYNIDKENNVPNTFMPKQHSERAKNYNKFLWDSVEFLTGKDNEYHHKKYGLGALECTFYDIRDYYHILLLKGEGESSIFIPKEDNEYHQWFLENINIPYRKVLKTNLRALQWDDANHYYRNEGIEFVEKMRNRV